MRLRASSAGLVILATAIACGSGNKDDGGFDSGPMSDGSITPMDDSGQLIYDGGNPTGDATMMPGDLDGAFTFDGFGKGDGNLCTDNDNDGFTDCAGDCDDNDSLVNPCAFDTDPQSGDPVGSDGKDNDCDGKIDNRRLCDGNLQSGHGLSAADYAAAVDICDNANPQCKTVQNAIWYGPQQALARRITKHMGAFVPNKGSFMAFFSTGIADDLTDNPNQRPGDGTDLGTSFIHPDPLKANQNVNPCGNGQDESQVKIRDYTELRLTLKAPINAGSFTFDFNFFSEEYPAYVCRGFNDTFLAMLTSKKYPKGFQIAYDPNNARVNVNNGFFQACTSIVPQDNLGYTHNCTMPLSTINGTGYEIKYCCSNFTDGNLNKGSGATGWLKTTAPIDPGETFTLSFIIFEEGDGLMDSAVNIDNFRWSSKSIGQPITAR